MSFTSNGSAAVEVAAFSVVFYDASGNVLALPLCFFHRDKFKQADTWVVESGDYWWTCKLHDLSPAKLVEWRPVH